MNRSMWAPMGIVGLVLLGLGCAQKLTFERYQTIHTGESPESVEATLGKPWQKTDMSWVYNDPDRQITAQIYFQSNEVIGKKWNDPEHQDGKSPLVNQPGESENLNIQTVE